MGRRWLLARPRGGLNDTLCQIEKCWRFAEQTGRELVIDTRDSGLLLDFHDVFEVRPENSKVTPHKLTEELVEELNKLSAFPADVQGNVTAYDKFKDEHDEFYTLPSRQPLKFSLRRDFSEDLVVYEGMGGGVDSYFALPRLRFRAWLKHQIEEELKQLPGRYLGIHVRHTDMRTNYEMLLAHVKKINRERLPVFLASDNDAVLGVARAIFGDSGILTLAKKADRCGQPLHISTQQLSDENRREIIGEAASELLALSGAEIFFFSEVSSRSGISGFSGLASHLSKRTSVRLDLLGSESEQASFRVSRPQLVAPLHRRLFNAIRIWRAWTSALGKS